MEGNISIIEKDDFPERLQEIARPPKKLFYRGKLPDWDQKFLAVVGTRKYSQYGKEVCEHLIHGLRGYPITIVSGLALGMDSLAHRSAMYAGLTTIAVPGSGLKDQVIYPSSNFGLSRDILKSGGALLSEFEPDFRATIWSFPQRNRIMAGISHAILVIEAAQKSGTLITSRLATEYNRDVLTVPHPIFSKTGEGPHMLLRLGATPITSPQDILDAFGINPNQDKNEDKYSDCSEKEMVIIKILDEPLSRDDLVQKSDLPTNEINSILTILEIKGIVKEVAGEIHLL